MWKILILAIALAHFMFTLNSSFPFHQLSSQHRQLTIKLSGIVFIAQTLIHRLRAHPLTSEKTLHQNWLQQHIECFTELWKEKKNPSLFCLAFIWECFATWGISSWLLWSEWWHKKGDFGKIRHFLQCKSYVERCWLWSSRVWDYPVFQTIQF